MELEAVVTTLKYCGGLIAFTAGSIGAFVSLKEDSEDPDAKANKRRFAKATFSLALGAAVLGFVGTVLEDLEKRSKTAREQAAEVARVRRERFPIETLGVELTLAIPWESAVGKYLQRELSKNSENRQIPVDESIRRVLQPNLNLGAVDFLSKRNGGGDSSLLLVVAEASDLSTLSRSMNQPKWTIKNREDRYEARVFYKRPLILREGDYPRFLADLRGSNVFASCTGLEQMPVKEWKGCLMIVRLSTGDSRCFQFSLPATGKRLVRTNHGATELVAFSDNLSPDVEPDVQPCFDLSTSGLKW